MHITFTFKHFEPSEHLKEYARSRFEKISKYYGGKDEGAEIHVNLAVEKIRHMAEVVMVADSMHLSAYQESDDMYSTIDLVLDKLEAQVKKVREKMKERRRSAKNKPVQMDFFSKSLSEEGDNERTIMDSDQYEPKPMNLEEAAMQLESKHHEFLVFLNSETDRINVIYLRKGGDFGVIDPGT
jgi:putative sigma-54 modulation protein